MNAQEDLSGIRVGCHDEIFQGDPVLTGVDPLSTYCYLLCQESTRDSTTWALHLLELSERGLRPDYTVAYAAKGIRFGQKEAWADVPCGGDVYHIEADMTSMIAAFNNRAYGRMRARDDLEAQVRRAKRKLKPVKPWIARKRNRAEEEETAAVALADDIRLLSQWMREDVLALVGPEASIRRELYDFIVGEMRTREHLPRERQVSVKDVRDVFELGLFLPEDPEHWQQDCALWRRLGKRYPLLSEAVAEVVERTVRASSMVENLNSRLRCYFFLRRDLGPEYLEILRFFLNHRRYPRSRKAERAGKSPAEILFGKTLPHWLEQLGYTRFSRAA